jgi:antitoxin VapB
MHTAKVFRTGRSQAVRLPKECRFEESEVLAHRVEDMVILFPATKGWRLLRTGLEHFSADFMATRDQPIAAEERRPL